jgi:hypothetical protein
MPRTAEDIENYLMRLERRFEQASSEPTNTEKGNGSRAATFLVQSGTGLPPIAVRVAPPIVAVNVQIGPAPADATHRLRLFTRLLELNAADLMYASYGLEGEQIVLSAGLALENLDINELEAALSDLDVALVQHVPELLHTSRD